MTPLLPSYWYVNTARQLEFGQADLRWSGACLGLLALSAVLFGLAALLFRRRFKTGARSA